MQNPSLSTSNSLRRTVLIALCVGFLLLCGAQYFFAGTFVTRELEKAETKTASDHLHSARQALQALQEDLDSTGGDWSNWDATYNFVRHRDPNFLTDNLSVQSLRRLRLNLVIIVDEYGRALYAKTLLNPASGLQDAPADLLTLSQGDGALSRGSQTLSGLVMTSVGAMVVTSQPVVDSLAAQSPKGRLIMGRLLNDTLVASLSRIVSAPLTVEPVGISHPVSPNTEDVDLQELEGGDVLYLGKGVINGHTTLTDLWGKPVAVLHVRLDRPLQATMDEARIYRLIVTILVALAFYVGGLLFIRSRVVVPIEKLASSVSGIGTAGSTAERIDDQYATGEFLILSRSINAMLDQIEQQQALCKDRDAAIEANRLKSEFLATMSHEIRTPMNGVLGMCELLQRTDLNPKQRHLCETLLRSARSLLGILNDVLDFAKIESGKLQLEAAPFSPVELLQTVSAPFIAAAQGKSLGFVTLVDGNVPPLVVGDALRLRQVMNNLLGNAVKFTARGSVTIGCVLASSQVHDLELRITVTDTGTGIPPQALERIFKPFMQAEASTARNFGGTGLGLAIVQRLVELMDGKIGVQSTVGQGSSFWFTVRLQRADALPALSIAQETQGTQNMESRTGSRLFFARSPVVLLAEDNAINRELLTEMIETMGCRVTAVENGAQAVTAAAARPFDVIFMDCQMPVLDGQAATVELRTLERATARSRACIVALTADATAENRERCLEAGMDSVVTKPVSQAQLRALLLDAMHPEKVA
ncbi:MAG TPA: ATP-binding protein [Steroidobacteraceae bacterium]|jgi:signal transduction histidine kinase/CheY-like chemotaxis protein